MDKKQTKIMILSFSLAVISAFFGCNSTDVGNGTTPSASEINIVKPSDEVSVGCDKLEFVLFNGAYSVSGIGECNVSDIVIPATHEGVPVKCILKDAFRGNTFIKSLNTGNVETIEDGAFADCCGLQYVYVAKRLANVGLNAFENCTALKSVEVQSLSAFAGITFSNANANPNYYADNLLVDGETVTSLSGVVKVGTFAFYGYSKLQSLYGDNTLMRVDNFAFAESGLEEASLGKYLSKIGGKAFYNCTNLKTVELGENTRNIGVSAFENCTALTTVYASGAENWLKIDFANKFANPMAYADTILYNNQFLTTLNIVPSIETLNSYAFLGQKYLTKVVVPGSVEKIESHAFDDCWSLECIEISSRVKRIDGEAFFNCTALTEITLPFIGSGEEVCIDTHKLLGFVFGATDGGYIEQVRKSARVEQSDTAFRIPETLTTVYVFAGNYDESALILCDGIEVIVK